jgi:hypothetical protein
VADERASVGSEQIVAALLAAAGLAPSADEIAALARSYTDLRAGLDALYLPEADSEHPLPGWLVGGVGPA